MRKPVMTVALLFAMLSPFRGHAGDNHNHEPAVEPAPHGGVLRDAAPYKAELVLNGDEAKIYVYDKSLKPAVLKTESLIGSIQLPRQKKHAAVTFKKTGDAFQATLPGVSKTHRYDLHVTLLEGDKKTVIDFGVDNIH